MSARANVAMTFYGCYIWGDLVGRYSNGTTRLNASDISDMKRVDVGRSTMAPLGTFGHGDYSIRQLPASSPEKGEALPRQLMVGLMALSHL